MHTSNRLQLGLVACDPYDIQDLLFYIRFRLQDRTRPNSVITFINAHVYNMAVANRELLDIISSADCVVADGMSIVVAIRMFGGQISGRCNMTEAFRAFLTCSEMPRTNALLLGGAGDSVHVAANEIMRCSNHCHVVADYSGYLTYDDYVTIFNKHSGVDLVLIGMGSPKSERIAALASTVCKRAVIWHVGGGTLNFLTGSLREAPLWMRRSGLQWLHRLVVEPRRMWKRYLIGNPLFVYYTIKAWAVMKFKQVRVGRKNG